MPAILGLNFLFQHDGHPLSKSARMFMIIDDNRPIKERGFLESALDNMETPDWKICLLLRGLCGADEENVTWIHLWFHWNKQRGDSLQLVVKLGGAYRAVKLGILC